MLFVLLAVAVFIVDYVIKSYVEKNFEDYDAREHLKGQVCLEKHHNKGVFLSHLQNRPKFVLVSTGIIIGVLAGMFAMILPKKREYLLKLAFAFVLGGATSNLIDRIKHGYVVDYIRFPKIKAVKNVIFNISDFFIFIGCIFMIIRTLKK